MNTQLWKLEQVRRMLRWTSVVTLFVLLVPLIPYGLAYVDGSGGVANPGIELWREIRQGVPGHTQAGNVDAGVLINSPGQDWRSFRTELLIPYSAIVFTGMLGLLLVYFLVRGRIRIEGGRSGHLVQRFTRFQRWSHWYVAVVFLTLVVTGLILLYGRWVLIPLLGPAGFSATAAFCKATHSYVGPLFVPAVILLFIIFERSSMFDWKVVVQWVKAGGGYLGGRHPHALKFNPGQKLWYWVAVLGGLVLCITGLVLDFPNFGQSRDIMGGAHVVHTVTATGVIAFFFIHLYLSTIGIEGVLEAMTSGKVDANWARQHHDLWCTHQLAGCEEDEPNRNEAPPNRAAGASVSD